MYAPPGYARWSCPGRGSRRSSPSRSATSRTCTTPATTTATRFCATRTATSWKSSPSAADACGPALAAPSGRGEGDRDGEAAVRVRQHVQVRVVAVGDRAHDRETQSGTPVLHPGRAEALERLQDPVDRVRRYDRTGVADREHHTRPVPERRDIDPAAVDVVADRVVQQVADQTGEQGRVGACHDGPLGVRT